MAGNGERPRILRVATWNLWWRFGPWETRARAIVDTMRTVDADVWCLQEVFTTRGGADQAEELAAALGGYHVVQASRFALDCFEVSFGNAVLARWPIVASGSRALPAPDGLDELRLVLRAEIDAPDRPVDVFSTHLNWPLDQSVVRQEQVHALRSFVAETCGGGAFPPVIAGDFNAEPESDEMQLLTGSGFLDAWQVAGSGTGATWDNRNPFAATEHEPDRRIDYLLVGRPSPAGPGEVLGAELVGTTPVGGTWPSDHFGVVADLRF